MKSILEELFYSNVCPNTDCRSGGKEAKALMGYIVNHHDALLKELTEKQKERLEKLNDCRTQYETPLRFFARVFYQYFILFFRSTKILP